MDPSPVNVLVCRCAERRLLDPALLAGVEGREGAVVFRDLCEASARGDPRLAELVRQPNLVVHACHPRAVRALFSQAGAPLPDSARVVNLRAAGFPQGTEPDGIFGWPPWFPVIDQERCTRCGQCLDFCLFGVYELGDDGSMTVAHPDQCKNNCPACARICPEAAIIFPKLNEEPINGADITDEAAVKANIQLNVDRILGDDVYAALEQRKAKRRRLLDRKKMEQALEERARFHPPNFDIPKL